MTDFLLYIADGFNAAFLSDSQKSSVLKGIVHLQSVPIDLHSVFSPYYEVNGDQQLKVNYPFKG